MLKPFQRISLLFIPQDIVPAQQSERRLEPFPAVSAASVALASVFFRILYHSKLIISRLPFKTITKSERRIEKRIFFSFPENCNGSVRIVCYNPSKAIP
jgi:hypothetical protein